MSIFSKVQSFLAGRKTPRPFASVPAPKPTTRKVVTGGSRGIGIGSREHPDLSMENIQKWQHLPKAIAEQFVYGGMPIAVHSTNVHMAQYDFEKQEMKIMYNNGSIYVYSNVTDDEAIAFVQYQSKGIYVWDFFRVRGSSTAHKKPYRRIQ